MKKLLCFIPVLILGLTSQAFSESISYDLFAEPPEDTPKIFAKDIISLSNRHEYGLSISPDFQELFYKGVDINGLYSMKNVGGRWTHPTEKLFRKGGFFEFEAFFNTAGDKLYFTSRHQKSAGADHFYYAEKTDNGWSEGVYLNSRINRTQVMWNTFNSEDTMYYGNKYDFHIYRSKLENGEYKKTANTGIKGVHPTIAPDDSFLLFNSSQYEGHGRHDLYIAIKKQDGSWGQPINLGDKINSEYHETCPTLSPDGKYIFFSRYNDINNTANIYWVSTSIIETLKQVEK